MNKKIIGLMIAFLSLLTYPYQLKASTAIAVQTENTVPPVLTPAMEKKIESFKKKHPDVFSKRNNIKENSRSTESQSARGIFLFLTGSAIIVVLVLIILMLI